MIYQQVNNTGKQRGSLNGSQHTNSWQSLMITSGENEIVTYANAQGVPARVILITNFSFKNEDKEFFGKVYNSVNEIEPHGSISAFYHSGEIIAD